MLDCTDEQNLIALWATLPSRTKLPFEWEEYATQHLRDLIVVDSKRRFARKSLRSIAVLSLDNVSHAVYLKDLSRLGVGFFAPLNVLPLKQIGLWLPGRDCLRLRVARCRRLGEKYYECGATFNAPDAHGAPVGDGRSRALR
ncbi:hypothetical protein Pla175_25560 [Pirellulimonas nuda]|uniref:PilZ domain-containing protein n=1 Tax=Pirellulimonas nuda TaxID=2528009 RepID=A0A518DCH1_9BACT|nr:PilZ domain-containing protein [Pirellulimonas nuda]QDU89169.1 hypothetical protein Pla175_25560 [Pirellulimonas nuda]